LEDHRKYHVVVYTEIFQDLDHVIEVNELCRNHGIGFILGRNFGPSAFAFLDYGTDFVVTDQDGEETKSFIVVSAT
jgi:predicted Fe-Mo cluster-binding NifX family protein